MTIPDHEHHVRLHAVPCGRRRTYGIRPALAVSLRLPYDIKDQHVRYTTLSGQPFVPPYGDIHHRRKRCEGISDGDLLVLSATPASGLSQWRFGFGTTLPLGHTVPDPWPSA